MSGKDQRKYHNYKNYQKAQKNPKKPKGGRKPKKFTVFLTALILISIGVFAGYQALLPADQDNPTDTDQEDNRQAEVEQDRSRVEAGTEETVPKSPYTGLPIEDESLQRPFALLIDNHPDARPPYGIQDASYVYEIIAEGGVTRLLSIFHEGRDANYGPIRSLRPYYAHLARENDAIMAHCGESHQTSALLWQDGYDNICEHTYTQFYSRDNTLSAPHNLFTNLQELKNGARDRGLYRETEIEPLFEISEDDNEESNRGSVEVGRVEVPFSKHNHVSYEWDDSREGYLRSINGSSHTDAYHGEQIQVNNIIVQYASFEFISDVHRKYHITGSGDGVLIQNGEAKEITWEKGSYDEDTKFRHKDGSEVKIVPGNTWIHILSPQKQIIIDG